MINLTEHDLKFINYAIRMAKINFGNTGENPSVGCVIVKDNQVLSAATTAFGGRPHAEVIAINKVENKHLLIGATMFVTLEPCSHYGRTNPCVLSIIEHKIAKVVICHQDIDSRVNGLGIKALQEAKIEVVLLNNFTEAQDQFFFYAKKHKKSWLTTKIATSLDGKIATQNQQSKWITSLQARQYANWLRSKYQAIMVGANTVKQDNPSLDCRIAGLQNLSPIKIVVSTNLDFTFCETIFNGPTIVYIITSINQQHNKNLQQWLAKNHNNQAIFLPQYNGLFDLALLLEKLYQHNINSVLLEGGAKLLTGFLQQNLVQELIWIKSQKILGNEGLSAVQNLNILAINDALQNLKIHSHFSLENDLITRYHNNSSN